MTTTTITNPIGGRKFTVRIIRTGEPYGLRDKLSWNHDEAGVEFYDASVLPLAEHWDEREQKHGQFVARYFASTLLADREKLERFGLCLYGGTPEWDLQPAAIAEALRWLAVEIQVPQLCANCGKRPADVDSIISNWCTACRILMVTKPKASDMPSATVNVGSTTDDRIQLTDVNGDIVKVLDVAQARNLADRLRAVADGVEGLS